MSGLKRMVLAAGLLAAGPIGFASAEELKIEGVGISRDLVCAEGDEVGVYGAENEVRITGPCRSIVVHGSKHKVTFETAGSLEVSGSENSAKGGEVEKLAVSVDQQTVEATLRARNGAAEAVIAGVEHKVTLTVASASRLTVNGVNNAVSWAAAKGAPAPAVSSGGAGNQVTRRG
ncbi:hypothetical protein GCM10008171_11370 [Methylopila jiangsuensis]|uniref:DUF3060 domain-containing protein n=1 Tax=Methylopila jiangsuensis TaxID=586230 RepID=A0A9W6N336_9HYPH|nr:DUF3060 domain-containing protein [Methylopila jiangsuensis]MDR6286123.1 hypothetical protein [Methylopila jiangsuensis]GLK75883.1 hypothetical protein GCM10008171_11370 [Methylopila jiangsuensis]